MTEPSGGLEQLLADRRAKVAALRAAGIEPYPASFGDRVPIADARTTADPLEPGETSDTVVRVAGRLVARRGQGRIAFLDIADESGRMQVMAPVDRLGEDGLARVLETDLGDLVGIEGVVARTRRGEPSVAADTFTLLAKSLRPPPDKHAGLKDTETRFRQRYLDMLSDPDAREVFAARARAVAAIRRHLDGRGFIEVETPALQPIYGGASARPFVTHHNALDRDLYLRIAPELYLKRCVVGGMERVYEIGKMFRNEGISFKHNPEYTSLESYEAYADYNDVMRTLEGLVAAAATAATGGTVVTYRGQEIDLTPPWRRLDLRDAIADASGIDVRAHADADTLRDAMRAAGHDAPEGESWAKLLDGLLSQTLEPSLMQPTFLVDYPVELSPFAKRRPDDPGTVERFEAFAGGMEIANAFSELNDPDDQRARMTELAAARAAGDEEAQPEDEDFLTALEYGMPPTGGLGVGIDRLVMLLTDRTSIREVIIFPAVRPRPPS